MKPSTARHRRRLVVVAVALASVWLAGWQATAEETSPVDEVVRMLEADLSEEVILQWLEGVPGPIDPVSADQLVALKKAGATDDLMKRLLDRTRQADAERPSPPSTPTVPAPTTPPPMKAPANEAPANEAPPSAPADQGTSQVTFQFSYSPRIDEYEVGSSRRNWDLYIYIDGIPVTYLTAAEFQNQAETMDFAREVPSGSHVLKVAQERHYRKGDRWVHETRAAGPSFRFDLRPGQPARLEVDFKQGIMDYQDPLAFRFTQGETVLDSGRVGGDTRDWEALCQDIEASVADGKKPNRKQRQGLDDCVDWTSWWNGVKVPPRDEVLDAMAEFDYRPRPKGS